MTKAHGASLQFESVRVDYGGFAALHETSLAIAPGEFFALLGPSGSGKSTLLGGVAGFVAPTGGRILLNGADIMPVPPYKRGIGMVFQNYSLFPFMTVAENVAFPLKNLRYARADIEKRVRQMLDVVRLTGFEDRKPRQLSGGQQQRVALARAAVYDPPLLLMDEPLGALDKNLREEMQDEIKTFHHKIGTTVLYVTHDQYEAAVLADRVGIMNRGRLEQVAPPKAMYENPCNAFVAGFLGEANLFPANSVTADGDTLRVAVDGDGDILAALAPIPDGSSVACVRPERISLTTQAYSGQNVFSGVVEDVVFSAGNYRYRFRLDSGRIVIVRPPVGASEGALDINARAYLSFPSAAVRVIPR